MTLAGSTSVQVGLGGSFNSNFVNRASTTSWTNSAAGNSNTATMTASAKVFPLSGTSYHFTIPSLMVFNTASVSGVNSAPEGQNVANVPMFILNVNKTGATNPRTISQIDVSVLTQNLGNVDSVNVFYTGSTSSFNMNNLFGTIGSPLAGSNAIGGSPNR